MLGRQNRSENCSRCGSASVKDFCELVSTLATMLNWKVHGDLIEDPAITFHIDTTAVGTYHDLHQILFIENLLHEILYAAKNSTSRKMNMVVGTSNLMQSIKDSCLEDIDKVVEQLFASPMKTSTFIPIYDHAFTKFIGEYGHLYASLIPTLVYIVITFMIPIDYQAFLKRQSKNNTVLTVIIYIKDDDNRYHRPAEMWRKASAEYSNVRFIALDNDSDMGKAARSLF